MSLKRKKPLRRQSKKRAKESREYMQKRREFLAFRPVCEVWIDLTNANCKAAALLKFEIFKDIITRPEYATDIHHKEGRAGSRYLDETTWMAVSRKAHRFIHDNPAIAKEWGWLK